MSRGDFVLGPVDLQLDCARPGRRHRAQRRGQVDAARAPARPHPAGRRAGELGSGVVVGEVDQARALFLGDEPLVDAFALAVPEWPTAEVRTLLAKFGLGVAPGDAVRRPTLSPGERTRAALALLQARGVNLLVLDEPTNHLDLPAIEQLEEALESFDGTVLLVTHDRRMLDTVRLTRRWHVEDGQVVEVAAD